MQMNSQQSGVDRQGFAMATTLLVVLVLSVIAVAAAWLASTEKKTSFAEGVHITSLFSADAGSESAINFLRLADSPPPIVDFANQTVRNQGTTAIQDAQTYDYDCRWLNKQPKPGWGLEFVDYNYQVASRGTAAQDGQSNVNVIAGRLFREGYN